MTNKKKKCRAPCIGGKQHAGVKEEEAADIRHANACVDWLKFVKETKSQITERKNEVK